MPLQVCTVYTDSAISSCVQLFRLVCLKCNLLCLHPMLMS